MKKNDQEITRLLAEEKLSLHAAARKMGIKYGTLRYRAVQLGIHKPKPRNVNNGRATCTICGNNYLLEFFPRLLTAGQYQCKDCLGRKEANPHYCTLVSQYGEQCQICGRCDGDDNGAKLAVDHCHKTGKIRGLLCNRCNRGIGFLQDDVNLLQQAIEYLRTH